MKSFRRAFYYFRVLLLVALFAGAYVLHRWSRDQDPRFFHFLSTPPGRLLARLFGWQALPMDQVVKEKPTHEMTAEELRVRVKLEQQLSDLIPRHRVELVGGEVLTGTVMEETAEAVRFRQGYGDSATIETTFARHRVRAIGPSGLRPPPVTYRDIRFQMEFPGMTFYKLPPYTFLSDESYLNVIDAVENLQVLYRQFREAFGALIDPERVHDDLQVLSFGDERKYRDYQRATAPDLGYAVGFYAPTVDRLVVFNQAKGSDVLAWQKVIASREAAYRQDAVGEDDQRRIEEWRRQADRHIAGIAQAQTVATLRHEGAHQLFFTLGVHSWHRAETEWLIEGLAAYCETPQFGEIDANRAGLLRRGLRDRSLIPLRELMTLRVGEFSALEPGPRIAMAYAQSWGLVRFLMQPAYQGKFFDYVLYLRDPRNLETVRKTPPLDLLAGFIGLNPVEFERRWKEFVAEPNG